MIIYAVECAFPYHIDRKVLKDCKEKFGLEKVQYNSLHGNFGEFVSSQGKYLGYGGRKGEEELFMSSLTRSLGY